MGEMAWLGEIVEGQALAALDHGEIGIVRDQGVGLRRRFGPKALVARLLRAAAETEARIASTVMIAAPAQCLVIGPPLLS